MNEIMSCVALFEHSTRLGQDHMVYYTDPVKQYWDEALPEQFDASIEGDIEGILDEYDIIEWVDLYLWTTSVGGWKVSYTTKDGAVHSANEEAVSEFLRVCNKPKQYEALLIRYDREYSHPEHLTFKAPNDATALIYCICHQCEDDVSEFMKEFEEETGRRNITIDEATSYAESILYGDGDDHYYFIRNVNTGEVLYSDGRTFTGSADYGECRVDVMASK